MILKSKKKNKLYPAYSTYVVDELTSLIAEKEGFTEKIANAADEQQKIYIQNQLQTKIGEVIQKASRFIRHWIPLNKIQMKHMSLIY